MRICFANVMSLALTGFVALQSSLLAHYIVVEDGSEASHVFSIDSNETFSDVMVNISKHMSDAGSAKTVRMKILPENYHITMQLAKKPRPAPRSYAGGLSRKDAEDIAYIVTTLANSSLPKIKSAETSLKKAGDRIDPVHPLQFLLCVFSNEELKVAIRNLQGRSWVWSDFIDGITKTLAEENGKNNIQPYLGEFASKLNVSINILQPLQQSGKWEKFVTTLIDVIPRADGSGRYDQ